MHKEAKEILIKADILQSSQLVQNISTDLELVFFLSIHVIKSPQVCDAHL